MGCVLFLQMKNWKCEDKLLLSGERLMLQLLALSYCKDKTTGMISCKFTLVFIALQ